MNRKSDEAFHKSIAEVLESRRYFAAEIFSTAQQSLPFPISRAVAVDFNRDGIDDLIGITSSPNRVVVQVENSSTITTAGASSIGKLVTADFDLDGFLDVAVSHADQNEIAVFKNDSGVALLPRLPFAAQTPIDLAAGDINSDGNPDLVWTELAADSSTKFNFALGNGDGTLSVTSFPLLPQADPTHLTIADMDADGRNDLVFLSRSAYATILRGRGDGTFQFEISTYLGDNLYGLAIGDLNGDRYLDVAVSSGLSSASSVYAVLYNGSLTLTSTKYSAGTALGFRPPVIFDANADDIPDVAVRDSAGGLKWFAGAGAGVLQVRPSYPSVGGGSDGVMVGDFNGDGRQDLRAMYAGTTNVAPTSSTLFGSASKGIFETNWVALSVAPTRGATADANQDGLTDVIVTRASSSLLTQLLGDGQGHVSPTQPVATSGIVDDFTLADLDGDNKADIAAVHLATKTIEILRGSGNTQFTAARTVPIPSSYATSAIDLASADTDGNGTTDLLFCTWSAILIFRRNLDATYAPAIILPTIFTASEMLVRDINGDAVPDIAVSSASGNAVEIFINSGTGMFAPSAPILSGSRPLSIAAGDMNQDGTIDLAVYYDSAPRRVSFLSGDGAGAFTLATEVNVEYGTDLQIADMTGDGLLDVVALQNAASALVVLKGQTNSWPMFDHRYVSGQGISQVILTDLNADSRTDVVGIHNSTKLVTSTLSRTAINAFAPVVLSTTFDVNSHEIIIRFDSRIDSSSVKSSDLMVYNATSNALLGTAHSFAIDTSERQVRYHLPLSLPDGLFRVEISSQAIINPLGMHLRNDISYSDLNTYLLTGDISRDKRVNFDDLLILAQNYGQSGRTYSQGNVNYSADGKVDFDDLLILAQRYGTSLYSASPIRGIATKSNSRSASADLLS